MSIIWVAMLKCGHFFTSYKSLTRGKKYFCEKCKEISEAITVQEMETP